MTVSAARGRRLAHQHQPIQLRREPLQAVDSPECVVPHASVTDSIHFNVTGVVRLSRERTTPTRVQYFLRRLQVAGISSASSINPRKASLLQAHRYQRGEGRHASFVLTHSKNLLRPS